jgi:hypothetical protein
MDKKTERRRLDPGVMHEGIGSSGLGATDDEMAAMMDDPRHTETLRKVFSFLDDDEFDALNRSVGYELNRPADTDDETGTDDDGE